MLESLFNKVDFAIILETPISSSYFCVVKKECFKIFSSNCSKMTNLSLVYKIIITITAIKFNKQISNKIKSHLWRQLA